MCESFPPPGQAVLARSIGSVSWHVTYYNGCEKDHRFEVRFYRGLSNPNRPDIFNPVATYIVGPGVVREVGWVTGWGEPSKRLELAARLDPPFDPALIGGQGWFSIVSVAIGGQSCYALLGSANEGDGVHWLQRSFGGGTETGDVHYCLGGTARGACCDDRTTECTDDELQFVCSLQGRRVGSEACQDLAPPCGLMPGACCLGDETCRENQTRAECESVPGAHWRGPGTTCAECRWVHCLPGAHVEIEPCGQSTNGGCTVEPATFETIAAGGVVCGTAWADGGQRDEDWYEFVLLQSTESLVIQSVEVEVPVRITFYYAHDYYGCRRAPGRSR